MRFSCGHAALVPLRHGGHQEGPLLDTDGELHAALRDPDGNTIELYQTAP